MGNASQHRRQKKLEKAKKKRGIARERARQASAPPSWRALARSARAAPFGPAWVSVEIDEMEELPGLVTVLITRRVKAGLLLPEIVLVDRTCLGIKDATLLEPMNESDLSAYVRDLSDRVELRPCEPIFAQSVVFNALDYAHSVGFGPHRDFESALFEPRPEQLLQTPMATSTMPYYVAGPRDDVQRVLRTLDAKVGPGRYHFIAPDFMLDEGELDDEEDYDDDDDCEPDSGSDGESAEVSTT